MCFQVYSAINEHPEAPDIGELPKMETATKAIVEFNTSECAVMENVGKFQVHITRHGRMDNTIRVR